MYKSAQRSKTKYIYCEETDTGCSVILTFVWDAVYKPQYQQITLVQILRTILITVSFQNLTTSF